MRRFAFTFAAISLAACGLSVTGIAINDDDVIVPPEGGEDAPSAIDAERETGTVVPSVEASVEASADASVEASADADASVDASPDADADADSGPPVASFDAGPGCTILIDETFDTAPAPEWQSAGGAPGWSALNPGRYVLTNKNEDQVARALWYTKPLTFTARLRAQVDFVVDPTQPTSGSGLRRGGGGGGGGPSPGARPTTSASATSRTASASARRGSRRSLGSTVSRGGSTP